MYVAALINTPSYTQVRSYVVWRVHSLGLSPRNVPGKRTGYPLTNQ